MNRSLKQSGTSRVTVAWLRLKLPMLVVLASICTVGTVFGNSASAYAPAALSVVPRFEPAPCPFIPAADQIEGLTVRCGFVVVPEDRTRPDHTWIRLAVAIFKSPVVATRPPLIFLGGGPGSFVLDDFGPRVTGSLAQDLTSGRDFVMFDQRGVGFSQPSLSCQELGDLNYRTIGSQSYSRPGNRRRTLLRRSLAEIVS